MSYKITGTTKFAALLGSPVSHSLSPQIHNESFQNLGIDCIYLAFDVKSQQLKEVITGLKAMNTVGFNLTMPLKTEILPLLDKLTPAAKLAQSVNTVINKNGVLIGDTTDGVGYMHSIKAEGHTILNQKMTLLGGGGAATAICVQAALDGVSSIDIFKRKNTSWPTTLAFCNRVEKETGCQIQLYDITDLSQLKSSIAESCILTNATNVGMAPNLNQSILPDTSYLFPELIVSDIIYNPKETLLLQQAKEAGCRYLNGLYMLLYQGAASFMQWTGKEMPIELIKEKYFSTERN